MDKTTLLKEFEKIQDEDSWYEFDKRYFEELKNAPLKNSDELDRESRRKPVNVNGVLWMPVRRSLLIDEDMEFFHWKLREKIFSRLEPEAAAENSSHPERYARWCLYCGIRTNERSSITCPICEHELLDLPLNDMTD